MQRVSIHLIDIFLYQLLCFTTAIFEDGEFEGETVRGLDINEADGHLGFVEVELFSELPGPVGYLQQELVSVQVLAMVVRELLALNQLEVKELTL